MSGMCMLVPQETRDESLRVEGRHCHVGRAAHVLRLSTRNPDQTRHQEQVFRSCRRSSDHLYWSGERAEVYKIQRGTSQSKHCKCDIRGVDHLYPRRHSCWQQQRRTLYHLRWTKNGVELANSFAAVGQAPSLQFGETGAVARFINPEPVEVIYSNIRLFKDNDIDRFNLSQFDTATGVLVSGLPTAVSLLPGESLSLPFGSFDPTKYELALANVAVASSPGDQFGVGAGAVAPEPATLLLFGTTAAGLGLVRWRQRRRKQQP
jgi:hypothetical protein